jgi:hypothetical protein
VVKILVRSTGTGRVVKNDGTEEKDELGLKLGAGVLFGSFFANESEAVEALSSIAGDTS